jgi:PmbA protein
VLARLTPKGNKLEETCELAEKILKNKRLDGYEIFGISSTSNEIQIYKGEIENLSFSDTTGLGIRVFNDCSIGYAYTSMLGKSDLEDTIDLSIKNSKITEREEINYLPEEMDFKFKDYSFDKKSLYSSDYSEIGLDKKTDMAKKLERIALDKDKRIKEISDLIYEDGINEVMIINSNGFKDGYRSTDCFMYLSVISRDDDDTSTGDFFDYTRSPKDIDIERLADTAIKRSVSILGGRKIDSVVTDVILEPIVASRLIGALASTFSAESTQKGKSLFANMLGEKIFSKSISLIDDGKLKHGMASRPFDSEGAPKGRTVIVDKGTLRNFLYNTYTARKDNRLTTGNSARSSYKSLPGVGVSNLFIETEKGEKTSKKDMVKSVVDGFYVSDVIGIHSGINPVSGDISVGAKGIWIKNGELSFPVKEVTIATDIISLFKNITCVGDDITFMPSNGYIGSPSLMVKDISIGGK